MRLWLDPDRLAGARRSRPTTSSPRSATRTCRWRPARWASRRRCPGRATRFSVRAVGGMTEPAEFDNIILKRGDGRGPGPAEGRRPRRAGRRERTAPNCASTAEEAVGIGVTQLPTANALAVYQADDRRAASGCRSDSRRACSTNWRSTTPSSCPSRFKEVLVTLLEAIGLVVLVMFVFLQDWRSTVIPALTIPVSLVGTFAFVRAVRLLDQHAHPVRHHARHGPRRRRCDRRGGERPAAPARVREDRARGRLGGHGRGRRAGHRNRPRAGGGLRAGRRCSRARPAACTSSSR